MSLERAAKLLATINKLRLKNILCDVLLQSQKVESEMLGGNSSGGAANEATIGTAGNESDEASIEASDEASEEASEEASDEASDEASIEASSEASDETFGQTSIEKAIEAAEKITNDIPGVLAHRAILAAASPALHEILLKAFKERQKRVVIPERKDHLDMLLKKVRFELVQPSILSEQLNAQLMIGADTSTLVKIIKVLDENESVDRRTKAAARSIYRPQAGEASSSQQRAPQPAPAQQTATLFVAGGKVGADCTKTVLTYSLPTGRWKSVAPLDQPRNAAGAVLLGGRIYIIGGDDGVSRQSTVYVYDTAQNSWSTGQPLKTARNWLGTAELGGRLYAVGGWDPSKKCLNSAEAMDPNEGVWRGIAPMTTGRRALGVVALHNKLYAVGGYDGKNTLNSIERYDPTADKWESMETMMTERRVGVGVGVVDNVMYAVGGCTWFKEDGTLHSIVHQSVEMYSTGWETTQPMPDARRGAAVTADNDRLYVAGGYSSMNDNDLISKVFVLEAGTWSELLEMPSGRAGAAAVVLHR